MADNLFNLEIVTPQKGIFSGSVESFSAPGVVGAFEVLRNHAPLLSAVAVGLAKFVDQSGEETVFAASGGFVEVNKNNVIFLADTAEKKEEIDTKRAQAAKARAEERLQKKEPGTDIDRARAALARAINRLKIAGTL